MQNYIGVLLKGCCHIFSSLRSCVCLFCFANSFLIIQWNAINTVTNETKKFGSINGVAILTRFFFLQENAWRFLPGGPKKVAVIIRWSYYRGGRKAGFHCIIVNIWTSNQKIIGSTSSGITWTVFNLGCVFASLLRNILFWPKMKLSWRHADAKKLLPEYISTSKAAVNNRSKF